MAAMTAAAAGAPVVSVAFADVALPACRANQFVKLKGLSVASLSILLKNIFRFVNTSESF
jgi:hypothetical protein